MDVFLENYFSNSCEHIWADPEITFNNIISLKQWNIIIFSGKTLGKSILQIIGLGI